MTKYPCDELPFYQLTSYQLPVAGKTRPAAKEKEEEVELIVADPELVSIFFLFNQSSHLPGQPNATFSSN